MPVKARDFFEPKFNTDFGNVKIHSDNSAHEMASSVNAKAFTYKNNIVFNNGQYNSETAEGRKLLAHELTHVVQQNKVNPKLQLAPITSTIQTRSSYDINGSTQVKSSRKPGFADIQLSFDESSKIFAVTFPLLWIFAHDWTEKQGSDYVKEFEASVKRVWQNRFMLKEKRGKNRSAHVYINFDNTIVPKKLTDFEEARELSKIRNAATTNLWTMDVRNLTVRANVSGSRVELDADANKPQKHKGKDLAAGARFHIYGPGDKRTYTQTASAHEFGHMIGLGDEYIEDSTNVAPGNTSRGIINNRIMNVGENVTADAYAPFADWLSGLTSTDWVVAKKVK